MRGLRGCYVLSVKLTVVFEPAEEGGSTCFVEEIPAAIFERETLEGAKRNLLEALDLVLQAYRNLAKRELSPHALRQPILLAEG